MTTTERFSLYRPRRKLRISRWLLLLSTLLLLPALVLLFRIPSALLPRAKAAIVTETTKEVQSVIRAALCDFAATDLVVLSRDADGSVTALETDALRVATLHAAITESVIERFDKQTFSMEIPLGDLCENVLFAGRGPSLPLRFTVSPRITCRIENEFRECGINQTLHRLVAYVTVETNAWILLRSHAIAVEVPYCLSETVIVGKVPDAYTKINRFADDIAESEIDDIYDFGAAAE